MAQGKQDGITFKVDDVLVAKSLLNESQAKDIIEYKIGKQTLFIPDEHQDLELVIRPGNALITTLQECYNSHRPLVLSPDAIWLAICQGTAIHINRKIDSLQPIIFSEDKPKELIVRNDSLEFGGKHWKSLIDYLSIETQKYTKQDFYSFFVPQFTTTSAIEKTAYQITLLESYKQVFTYVGETGCGIVSVTLSGTKQDWVDIYNRLDRLKVLGLDNWVDNLKPVIQEFVNAFDNKIDKSFWSSIYKDATEYNGFYISGWFIKFFPYVKYPGDVEWTQENYDEENGGMKTPINYIPNPYINGDDYLMSTLSTDNFPSGLSQIEIIWNNYFNGTTRKMDAYSGFFGMKQYPNKTLEPFISWAICDKEAEPYKSETPFPADTISQDILSPVPREYWVPHVVSEPDRLAVYNSKKFDTQEESINFITTYLEKLVKSDNRFKNENLKNIEVSIVVLSSGKLTDIEISQSNNTDLNSFIKKELLNLPDAWLPALEHPGKALMLMDFDPYIETEEFKNMKVKVNSKIAFTLFK